MAAVDYVGAPFEPSDAWVRGKAWLAAVGGNGGLSLRRKSHAIECLDAASWQHGQWEDAFFVEQLQLGGRSVAASGGARAFAIERPVRRPRRAGVQAAEAADESGEGGEGAGPM